MSLLRDLCIYTHTIPRAVVRACNRVWPAAIVNAGHAHRVARCAHPSGGTHCPLTALKGNPVQVRGYGRGAIVSPVNRCELVGNWLNTTKRKVYLSQKE